MTQDIRVEADNLAAFQPAAPLEEVTLQPMSEAATTLAFIFLMFNQVYRICAGDPHAYRCYLSAPLIM